MSTTPLILGAMNFGTTVDEATSFALLDRFVERGGEWIDTADCYTFWASDSGFGGQSEELLGRWMGGGGGGNESHLSRTRGNRKAGGPAR
jgi:aryl-alcohol dehydrogenase-like predicted oxidoreductase